MPILLLDLDRTLFDTSQFMHEAWQVVARAYKLNLQQVFGELRTYYCMQNELVAHYDFRAHLLARVGDVPEALRLIRIALAGRDFVFADAAAILTCTPSLILTCGDNWFQRFKLEFAPSLKDIPVEIILQPKREFIANKLTDRYGWLVDDKPDQNLPSGFIEITLDRSNSNNRLQQSEAVFLVNSLHEAKRVVGTCTP